MKASMRYLVPIKNEKQLQVIMQKPVGSYNTGRNIYQLLRKIVKKLKESYYMTHLSSSEYIHTKNGINVLKITTFLCLL